MSLGADIYAGLYANADLIGTLSTDEIDAFACICSGIQNDKQDDSNLGIVITQGGSIHVLTANEPTDGIKHNSKWTFTDATAQTFEIRVIGIKRRQGLTTLTVEAINQ